MAEVSNWRVVTQCLKCTLKYPSTVEQCKCGHDKFKTAKMYCLDKILSYNAFINVMVGGRRKGKTYSVAEFCIARWNNNKTKFVWTRRYKTEMKKALESFSKLGYNFDDKGVYYTESETVIKINKAGKEVEKEITKKTYIGSVVTLTTASRIRGGEFTDYNTLVIDEYGDEAGTALKNEFTLINSLITSIIDEKEDGIVFVLSNNVNRFLPLYQHAEVDWEQEWTYNWTKDVVVHVVQEPDRVWNGKSAKWLSHTEYYKYAVYNQAMDESPMLISKNKLEFLESEDCFKLGWLTKLTFRILQYETGKWAVDNCNGCVHDWKVIDKYSSVEYLKKIDRTFAATLMRKYATGNLKFTSTMLHQMFKNWVALNLDILEK